MLFYECRPFGCLLYTSQPLLFLAFFTLLYFNLHNHWIVVAAQIQVWRVVCNTLTAGGVEDVVNTQHAFGIAVGDVYKRQVLPKVKNK